METFYHQGNIYSTDILPRNTIGEKIKYYRLIKNLHQEQLANLANIDRTTLIRYENDQLIPSLDITTRIAHALKINPFLIYDDYLKFIAMGYGGKIKNLRVKLKFTQKEFGQLLGVHRKTILRWEKEFEIISRENYEKLKKLL